jgi:hypothetical protein
MPLGVVVVLDGALGAGHARNAEALCRAFGLDLVAHEPDMLGFRPMKAMRCDASTSAN